MARTTEPSTVSGDAAVGSSPVTVVTGSGRLCGLSIWSGTGAATVIAYDNTTNSGTVLWRMQVSATGGYWSHDFSDGIVFNTGLTLAVTGTNAIANCYYKFSA